MITVDTRHVPTNDGDVTLVEILISPVTLRPFLSFPFHVHFFLLILSRIVKKGKLYEKSHHI